MQENGVVAGYGEPDRAAAANPARSPASGPRASDRSRRERLDEMVAERRGDNRRRGEGGQPADQEATPADVPTFEAANRAPAATDTEIDVSRCESTECGDGPDSGSSPNSIRNRSVRRRTARPEGGNAHIQVQRPVPVDISATRDCHCLAARKRAREKPRRYEEKLRPHGLRATQFSVPAALATKGPTPLGELADVLGLERTTLTRSANRTEDEEWVAEAESEGARVRRLKLTPAGRERVESAYPVWKKAQDAVDGQMDRLAME